MSIFLLNYENSTYREHAHQTATINTIALIVAVFNTNLKNDLVFCKKLEKQVRKCPMRLFIIYQSSDACVFLFLFYISSAYRKKGWLTKNEWTSNCKNERTFFDYFS